MVAEDGGTRVGEEVVPGASHLQHDAGRGSSDALCSISAGGRVGQVGRGAAFDLRAGEFAGRGAGSFSRGGTSVRSGSNGHRRRGGGR